ncbi:hypothetical protein GLOTRDRAFT_71359 [Gloeophyllum trabeum ATCC 11539]|uniref:18S rRNA factor 2 n=1 Tax=Gloeophyllum trabeum (strain ATCC 11539 / FP-39264 / Madison 617) TaxID=670483 RepID=S7S1Q8_GLOTA|nr:uncharacterized protein GLOTRDRAFT_71359 [Gloeophyllum trabeum ATCC 11539]EPQ59704.1 hypothetical protein GLOTRDRAFT_71359 [Gloeophyllum trabeum ATCC 11539]
MSSKKASKSDSRFTLDSRFAGESDAESSNSAGASLNRPDEVAHDGASGSEREEETQADIHENPEREHEGLGRGMAPEGFSGPDKIVKPLTPEALAAFKAAQERAGVVYISRIPPGMQPRKVRHLMSAYGEVGRVYLQQEDPKRAYLRRKYTTTKKPHFTEGWVEFKDKKVARAVAEMLNARPIGGKKGSRWRDDVWTMKYLPKFKWNMLTEQIAHEAAIHTARLRVELSQSRSEQHEYLKNVELARVLDKRAERKRQAGKDADNAPKPDPKRKSDESKDEERKSKKRKVVPTDSQANEKQLESVLDSIF